MISPSITGRSLLALCTKYLDALGSDGVSFAAPRMQELNIVTLLACAKTVVTRG